MAYTEDRNYHEAIIIAFFREAVAITKEAMNATKMMVKMIALDREEGYESRVLPPLLHQFEQLQNLLFGVYEELQKPDPDLAQFEPYVFELLREDRRTEIMSFVEAWACEYFELTGDTRNRVEAYLDDSWHTHETTVFPVELDLPGCIELITIEVTRRHDGKWSARRSNEN